LLAHWRPLVGDKLPVQLGRPVAPHPPVSVECREGYACRSLSAGWERDRPCPARRCLRRFSNDRHRCAPHGRRGASLPACGRGSGSRRLGRP
jgi:hypothetical protein